MAKKDYPRAMLEFRNALKVMPQDAEVHYELGLAYLGTGNFGNGILALRTAVELNPKHKGAQVKLAELMTATHNQNLVAEAAGRLRDVLAASPGNNEASNALALAEIQLGKAADAEARLEQALAKFPAALESSVTLARVKLSRQDLKGAETVLQKAMQDSPQSSQAALALGELYLVLQQPGKAEPAIRKAFQLDPGNGAALIALAAIQTAGNRLGEADQTYRQLAKLPQKEYRSLHALFLVRTGRREEAIAEFERLAKEDPEDRIARTSLLRSYLDSNRIPQAEALLAAALARNSKDTEALLERSEMYLRSGRLAEAETDLSQVLHFRPDFAEAHYALAGVHKARGQALSEQQELREALRLRKNFLQARVALAQSLIYSQKPTAAVELLDEADTEQNILAVVVERNWALLALGDSARVRQALDRVLRIGRVPDLVLQDAIVRMMVRDYAGARAAAEEVLSANPEDARAARIVTDSYAAQGDGRKALERLTQIVAARPGSAPLQHMLGQWYLSSGNLAAARNAFEAARVADPKSSQEEFALAEVDRREGRSESASQRLANIVAANPRDISALMKRATLEDKSGNRSAATGLYRNILDMDASNIPALNNLAYDLALTDPNEALKFAQQALELAPGDSAIRDTLGWVYYRKGIYRTAVIHLKEAVAKKPTPRREFHLAMAYLKAGDRSLGEPMLRKALNQDPTLAQTEQGW